MEKLTTKTAIEYINHNYGRPRHNVEYLVKACKAVARAEELDAVDLFFLLIENKPVPNVHTHSYGFHTNAGRHLIDSMQGKYYQLIAMEG